MTCFCEPSPGLQGDRYKELGAVKPEAFGHTYEANIWRSQTFKDLGLNGSFVNSSDFLQWLQLSKTPGGICISAGNLAM